MRRILALLLPLLLLVTACSGGTSTEPSASASVTIPPAHAEVLASVKVADQGKSKAPKVTFDMPVAITAESMKLVTQGTGAQVTEGQNVAFREIALNGTTGKTLGENFTATAGGTVVLNDAFKTQFPLVYTTFLSAKVGSYIAYGVPETPAVAAVGTTPAVAAIAASVSVFQIESATDVVAPLTKPSGTTVAPVAGLPTVKEDATGIPVITIGTAKAPTKLVAQDLVTGKGAVVKATDTIVANYVGVNFVGGKIFDSSFAKGTAATFALSEVIKGWTQGLTGKTVGSRVLLVIPQDLAYGATGSGEAKGDLVFVVDILGIQ